MSHYTDNLEYSLAKRVPAMESGFHIQTDYGEIYIDADEGKAVVKAVRGLLEKKLKRAREAELLMQKAPSPL